MELANMIMSIATLIISITFVIVVIGIATTLIIGAIRTNIHERDYKKNILVLLVGKSKYNEEEIINSMLQAFKKYKNPQIGFSDLDISKLNSILAGEIRTDTYKKYYNLVINNKDEIAMYLDELTKIIDERNRCDSDKVKEIVKNIRELKSEEERNNLICNVRCLYESTLAYCSGQVDAMNFRIQDMEKKLRINKWYKRISNILAIIGLISSIVTIYQACK